MEDIRGPAAAKMDGCGAAPGHERKPLAHLFIWMKQAQQGRLGRSNPRSHPQIAFIDMGVDGPGLHDEEPAPERSRSEVPATTSQAVSTGGRMEILGPTADV